MIPATDHRTGVVRMIGLAIERIGVCEVARLSGVDRVVLWRAFSKNGRGHPTLTTIERVLPHVGLELAVREVPQ